MQEDEWTGILNDWKERVDIFFEKLRKGEITPSPFPAPTRKSEGACYKCQVQTICGYKMNLVGYEVFGYDS